MKYLNLGCGEHFSQDIVWTNVDFISTSVHVMGHNLLKGIPFPSSSFDVIYHSHVLEHFSKKDGFIFLEECFRVLKSGGIIRIAIPDLEQIVRNYLQFLEEGLNQPNDRIIRANYDWMMIEMYDQAVRNESGGEMAKYLFQDNIINEEFIYQRIGEEGRFIRNWLLKSKNQIVATGQKPFIKRIINGISRRLTQLNPKPEQTKIESIGQFRVGGEIHQWMYDKYSLSHILNTIGFGEIKIKDAFSSDIANWKDFNLDGKGEIVRKPDSLYLEARKI